MIEIKNSRGDTLTLTKMRLYESEAIVDIGCGYEVSLSDLRKIFKSGGDSSIRAKCGCGAISYFDVVFGKSIVRIGCQRFSGKNAKAIIDAVKGKEKRG